VTRSLVPALLRGCALALAVGLAGCSSVESFIAGDKIDYRTTGSRTPGLEVPPDLTQLSRDARYQSSGGVVSAAAYQASASAPTGVAAAPLGVTTAPVAAAPAAGAASDVALVHAPAAPAGIAPGTSAPSQLGPMRVERQGSQRWLATSMTPEQIWPRLRTFWQDSGFTLVIDQAPAGLMETDWAENRAKIRQDPIRNMLGGVLDSLYSTGERDKFRTRVERTENGSEVYISHRGMEEVLTGAEKDSSKWVPRATDPELEAAMLARLMAKLGVKEETARVAVASAPTAPARARVVTGQPGATLQVDDPFDRAWRRVGLALDRGGFTVEDRDRTQGIYYVRYVDPTVIPKSDPGFIAKMFGAKEEAVTPARYRVAVKGDGDRSNVMVQNTQGAPENGEAAQRIVKILADDLK